MKNIITFQINKDCQSIISKEFYILDELEQLYIKVNIPEKLACMGYILIKDESDSIRLHKLLGHGSQNLGIGKTSMLTSIGGVPGKINVGKWTLNIYLFTEYIDQFLGDKTFDLNIIVTDKKENISEPIGGQCWVNENTGIDIGIQSYDFEKIYNNKSRWYKGDFHTHTTLSDGKETVKNAMKKAQDTNMDFYIPTEHNVLHTGWCDTDIMIVPGIEITTDLGHCNLFNVRKLPSNVLNILEYSIDKKMIKNYLEKIIRESKKENCIVSINHPFLHIWKWSYGDLRFEDFHCIEIVNDPTYIFAKEANDKAIRFLDLIWNDGHIIYGIGGSDSHNLIEELYDGAHEPSIPGDPGTFVFCDSLTPNNLLEGVRNGHIYVARYCNIDIEITANNKRYLPGDEIIIQNNTNINYKVSINGLKEKPIVYSVIDNVKKTD